MSLSLFHKEKIISKFWTSISWSKDRWRSYICIPSGAQTHIIAHTKGEPQARLSNPCLCRKKKYLTFLDVYILVKRPLEKLHLHPQWVADIHNSPHQRGAATQGYHLPVSISILKRKLFNKSFKICNIIFNLVKYNNL